MINGKHDQAHICTRFAVDLGNAKESTRHCSCAGLFMRRATTPPLTDIGLAQGVRKRHERLASTAIDWYPRDRPFSSLSSS